jgi:hypothetical protein
VVVHFGDASVILLVVVSCMSCFISYDGRDIIGARLTSSIECVENLKVYHLLHVLQ